MSEKFKKANENFWAAPQIDEADIREAAQLGVKLIINNRPDGEEPGQPTSAEVEALASAAGLGYAHIPLGPAGLSHELLDLFDKAVADNEGGPTLAYCKSGLRSMLVMAYASARAGRPVDEIVSDAASAGYDIAGHASSLQSISNAP